MTNTNLSRRSTLFTAGAAAAAAALFPLRDAVAQTAAAKGDWLAMVQAQHLMISKTFDELLGSANQRTYLQRDRIIKRLTYQLTAHSVAEENVLYPALASLGMAAESDKLYIDQAHAKVMNTQLQMLAMHQQGNTAWVDKARELQAAVLTHAKQDEEATLYPQLRQKLDAAKNAELTANFAMHFASVKPVRDPSAA